VSSGVLILTEAEVEVRRGVHARAESLAMHAARSDDLPEILLSRCYSVAGEAAHLRDDDRRAFTYFQEGATHATDDDDRERTLWGTFVAAVQLERPEAHDYLVAMNELEQPRISTHLRKATGELVWAIRFAGIGDIDDWIARYECYRDVQADPRIHTSFLHHFAYAMACSAHYQKARAVIRQEAREARDYRLDFVGPLAHLQDALCLIGLRKHAKAARLLAHLHEIGLQRGEDFILIESKMLMARLALAMGNADRAEELTREVPERIEPRGAYGQYLAFRALAFACQGDSVAARASGDAARRATVTLEAHTVASLADAVVALAHNAASDNPLMTAWNAVTASGQYDLLVAAYRAQPAILRNLWARPEIRPTLRSLLYRAADSAAAEDLPRDSPTTPTMLERLTDREAEVLDLVADGMTNQEIAEKLYIGLSTVKVHVRHILEKLEVRSRTEAALLRARQD
jgi:DNA-binding CsgD family transcriptional regulator